MIVGSGGCSPEVTELEVAMGWLYDEIRTAFREQRPADTAYLAMRVAIDSLVARPDMLARLQAIVDLNADG